MRHTTCHSDNNDVRVLLIDAITRRVPGRGGRGAARGAAAPAGSGSRPGAEGPPPRALRGTPEHCGHFVCGTPPRVAQAVAMIA